MLPNGMGTLTAEPPEGSEVGGRCPIGANLSSYCFRVAHDSGAIRRDINDPSRPKSHPLGIRHVTLRLRCRRDLDKFYFLSSELHFDTRVRGTLLTDCV